jgi:hypothetical protein
MYFCEHLFFPNPLGRTCIQVCSIFRSWYNSIFGPMPWFFFFNTQVLHIKSIVHNSIVMTFSKSLIPWRDSNPGILFQRPILNFAPTCNLWPQGRSCPPEVKFVPWGWSYPLGVKFSVHQSILVNSRECSPLGVNKGLKISPRGKTSLISYISYPLGAKFTPRGQVHPWWPGVQLRMALRGVREIAFASPPGHEEVFLEDWLNVIVQEFFRERFSVTATVWQEEFSRGFQRFKETSKKKNSLEQKLEKRQSIFREICALLWP